MSEGRKCCVFLPNDRKLELGVQSKLLGVDLMDIVYAHLDVKEKEYFGLCYKHDNGNTSWIVKEKKVLDHDFVKKSSSTIELHFAVKFYVDNIISLQHCLTMELYYLCVKSLVYKGEIDVDCRTAFKLAAHSLQIIYDDYTDENSALANLRCLPVIPPKLLQDHPTEHCETCILAFYQDLIGASKGRSILKYMTTVELSPTYGMHYYKVKDKSGLPWWLGLSSKGIFQFDFHNKVTPVKTYHWTLLENLYFREKKFSIEVKERALKLGDNKHLIESRKKSASDIKVFAWYGTPGLIKSIWLMSIAQHHFYLESKRKKFKDTHSVSQLAEKLTNNPNSLISPKVESLEMTQTQIKDVSITVKKGSKEESPEVRAAKREMGKALKNRRTELEDRLYEKVQELKKVCLQQAEIIGKYPPEYVRYMDLNEKLPKIKKRVGAEFKLKLRNKDGTSVDRDYPTTVTAASSSSSGFGSEATDLQDELTPLEQEFEILTQIANAAKKLASDPSAKGRIKSKRWNSYKRTCDKLQDVEKKINNLREKCGQEPSTRASMFISDEDMFVEELSLGGKSESEKSSLSDGMLLDDDASLSSGGDVLSTHSTPAVLNGNHPSYPNSAMLSRKTIPTSDTSKHDAKGHRSLTPPPSFDRFKSESSNRRKEEHSHYPMISAPSSDVNATSMQPPNSIPVMSARHWISQKWTVPRSRPTHGWAESSLDSFDTISTTSRQSDDIRSTASNSPSNRHKHSHEHSRVSPHKAHNPMKAMHSANSNQNNHNEMVKNGIGPDELHSRTKTKQEVSDEDFPDPFANSADRTTTTAVNGRKTFMDGSGNGLMKIDESPNSEHSRKRSSSLTESAPHRLHVSHRSARKNQLKAAQTSSNSHKYYPSNSQRSHVPRRSSQSDVIDDDRPSQMSKSQSAQELHPPIFETNKNIQMQYSHNLKGKQSYSQSTLDRKTSSEANTRRSQPDLHTLRRELPTANYHQNAGDPGTFYSLSPEPRDPNYYQTHPSYYYPPNMAMQLPTFDPLDHSDITTDWIPSLNEYSSRASVCETSSVTSRKEDILRVLEDHIAMKRTPSNASSRYAIKDSRKTKPVTKEDRTRPELRIQPKSTQTSQERINSNQLYVQSSHPANVVQQTSRASGGTYYRVLPAPKPARHVQETQPQAPPYSAVSPAFYDLLHPATNRHGAPIPLQESSMKTRLVYQHYLHHQHPHGFLHALPEDAYSSEHFHQLQRQAAFDAGQTQPHYYPLSTVPPDGHSRRPPHYSWRSESSDENQQISPTVQTFQHHFPSVTVPEINLALSMAPSADKNAEDTVVIQEVRKGPEGDSVSVFKIAKSAPNTPMMKRHKKPKQPSAILLPDSENETTATATANQDLSDLSSKLHQAFSDTSKPGDVSSVIVHRPSIKSNKEAHCNSPRRMEGKLAPNSKSYNKDTLLLPPKFNYHPIEKQLGKISTTPKSRPSLPTSDKSKVFKSNSKFQSHFESPPNRSTYQPPSPRTLPRASTSRSRFGFIQTNVNGTALQKSDEKEKMFERSQSDAWNTVKPPLRDLVYRQKSADELSSHTHHEPHQVNTHSRYRLRDDENYATMSKDRLSASAENLLWSETGGTQSGTLV